MERSERGAARHPIFWSHFTKSRSYFTIPLVARTMRLRAVFHSSSHPSRPALFFLLLCDLFARALPIRFCARDALNLTWGTTISFSVLPCSPFSLSLFLSVFFTPEKPRIGTRSFVRNLTINGALNGDVYCRAEFHPMGLLSSRSNLVFLFFFLLQVSLLLS